MSSSRQIHPMDVSNVEALSCLVMHHALLQNNTTVFRERVEPLPAILFTVSLHLTFYFSTCSWTFLFSILSGAFLLF